MHQARFGEDVYATPALVAGRIYLRTGGHVYCFGRNPKAEGGGKWQSRRVWWC